MRRLRLIAVVGAVFALIAGPTAWAAGMWWGWPQIGGAAYCTGYSQYPTAATVPGTQAGGAVCNSTAPAGPTLFSGTEAFPVDLYGTAPASTQVNTFPTSAYVSLTQVGQGPYVVNTAPATTQTIPNNTPWYIIQGGDASGWTVVMPSAPVEGQIQRIVCGFTTAGTLTVAANTSQTVVGNPNAVCTVGTAGFQFRYVAASTTWYRF